IASLVGTGWTFGAVAAASLGLAAWAAATPAPRPAPPQPPRALLDAFGHPRVLLSGWFVVLPALLFGTLGVLARLRLAHLGFGALGIGAVWLVTGALEAANNVAVGRAADRYGPLVPIRVALVATIITTLLLPWPDNAYVLAVLIGLAG